MTLASPSYRGDPNTNPMASYVLSFEERPEYLFARVTARFDSLALALQYWAGIAHECRRLGYGQVLVARQVQVSASRSDTVQIAGALRDLGFASLRIAYVELSPDTQATAAFGASIALQRGIEARAFGSIDRAAEWLEACATVAPPLLARADAAVA